MWRAGSVSPPRRIRFISCKKFPSPHIIISQFRSTPRTKPACGMAAYAFVNHWLSIFFDDNWMYPAVQVGVRFRSQLASTSRR